jgi:hypothetical protein
MSRTKVGIREFRANMASIPESKTLVMVTRHGETRGALCRLAHTARLRLLCCPSVKPKKIYIEAVRLAGEEMDAMIKAASTTAEELVAHFEELRREKRTSRCQR